MKRFFAVLIFAVGMLPLSAMAEASHTATPSGSKRVTADPSRTDFSSRAYSIAGACDTTRPGGTGDTGALPAGPGTGDLLSASNPGAGGGSPGASLFQQKCTKCHTSTPSGANFEAFVKGTKSPPPQMAGVFGSLTSAEKQALVSFLKGGT